MKVAATILYEDSYAVQAARFGLHDVIVRLIADEMPEVPVFRVYGALSYLPMNGVSRVLNALINDPHRHAPNGRMLVGCVDGDQLRRALEERKMAAVDEVKAASSAVQDCPQHRKLDRQRRQDCRR